MIIYKEIAFWWLNITIAIIALMLLGNIGQKLVILYFIIKDKLK